MENAARRHERHRGRRHDRHQWGPAPSGEAQHRAVCRRCGLVEVMTWCRASDGHPVEVVAWVAPTGSVVAARQVESQPVPALTGGLPPLEDCLVDPQSVAPVLAHCPGTPDVWQP